MNCAYCLYTDLADSTFLHYNPSSPFPTQSHRFFSPFVQIISNSTTSAPLSPFLSSWLLLIAIAISSWLLSQQALLCNNAYYLEETGQRVASVFLIQIYSESFPIAIMSSVGCIYRSYIPKPHTIHCLGCYKSSTARLHLLPAVSSHFHYEPKVSIKEPTF